VFSSGRSPGFRAALAALFFAKLSIAGPGLSMTFSESRFTLFRIMLYATGSGASRLTSSITA
jgi:hypothetical protein